MLGIELRALTELAEARDERNPKGHDLKLIEESIERFGFVIPVVLDGRSGKVAAGHGRIEVLCRRKAAGKAPPEGVQPVLATGEWQVPTTVGWESEDEHEALAFLIAANEPGIRGGWDPGKLATILQGLVGGPGFAGVGYSGKDIAALLRRSVAFDPEPSYSDSTGSHAEPDLNDRLAGYRNKEVRSLVLAYPLADYERVVKLATAQRGRLRVKANPELFLALLREWASTAAQAST